MGTIKTAFEIAKKDLRLCYYPHGIVAGRHHFTDYWARDGYFAGMGAMAIGDYAIVRKMLSLFFSYQRSDGLIPYRIMNGPMVSLGKYFLGKSSHYKEPKPTYKLRGIGQHIYDGTTLSLLMLAEMHHAKKILIKPYSDKVRKAISYLETKEKQGLLWDGVMAEWNDAVYKWGNLLYSNIIYWYALKRLSTSLRLIDPKLANTLKVKQKLIAKQLRHRLWNKTYFADWYDYRRQDYFYPLGNFMAIVWGFSTKKESKSILDYAVSLRTDFTFKTNYPAYPLFRVDLLHRLIGQADYHNNGVKWLQPGILYSLALKKLSRSWEARRQLDFTAKQIVDYEGVFEVYSKDGLPLKRLFYKSERPFAWSAGMFLWAYHSLGLNLKV